jgi:anti-sigma B factor antagonist
MTFLPSEGPEGCGYREREEGSRTVASDHAPALTVRDRWDGAEATVTVQGEIDVTTVAVLSGHLGGVAARNPQRLVIDLAGVGFLDSAGLQAFAQVRRKLPEDCPVIVRSRRPGYGRQVFEITGLSAAFAFE